MSFRSVTGMCFTAILMLNACNDASEGSNDNMAYVAVPTEGARSGHPLVGEWMVTDWVQDTCEARTAEYNAESDIIIAQRKDCSLSAPDAKCDSLFDALNALTDAYNSASTETWNVDMCKVGGITFMDNAQCWGSFMGTGVWNVTDDSITVHYLMLDGKTIDDSGHDEHLKYWLAGDTLRILRPAFDGDMAMDLSFIRYRM